MIRFYNVLIFMLLLSFSMYGQAVVETVSSGTSGDATLKIEADTDNNNENDNPIIILSQDGGLTSGSIGLTGDANSFFTNSTVNSLFVKSPGSFNFQIATNNIARFTVNNDGNVGIGTTTPNGKLDIYGANSNTTNLILAANYIDKYRWRFNTIDRGYAIDMDITASDSNDNPEAVLKLSRSSSTRPEFQLYNNAIVANNGKVGIGTDDPIEKLSVLGNVLASGSSSTIKIEGTGTGNYAGGSLVLSALGVNTDNNHASTLFVTHRGTDGNGTLELQRRDAAFAYKGSLLVYKDGYGWDFKTANDVTSAGTSTMLSIKNSGYVGIGTTNPDSKLTVAGNIHAREVKVTINAGADFVFNDDYKLPPLQEVSQFIKEHKHLPEIASEKDMQENGLHLAEMNIKLLQKIEGLTLYTIEQQKLIEEQSEALSKQSQIIKQIQEKLKL
ncbi:MAG: hypothetical protein ABJL44_19140 [Algibacter sp.]